MVVRGYSHRCIDANGVDAMGVDRCVIEEYLEDSSDCKRCLEFSGNGN